MVRERYNEMIEEIKALPTFTYYREEALYEYVALPKVLAIIDKYKEDLDNGKESKSKL